jgi:hypothetical protein
MWASRHIGGIRRYEATREAAMSGVREELAARTSGPHYVFRSDA